MMDGKGRRRGKPLTHVSRQMHGLIDELAADATARNRGAFQRGRRNWEAELVFDEFSRWFGSKTRRQLGRGLVDFVHGAQLCVTARTRDCVGGWVSRTYSDSGTRTGGRTGLARDGRAGVRTTGPNWSSTNVT